MTIISCKCGRALEIIEYRGGRVQHRILNPNLTRPPKEKRIQVNDDGSEDWRTEYQCSKCGVLVSFDDVRGPIKTEEDN